MAFKCGQVQRRPAIFVRDIGIGVAINNQHARHFAVALGGRPVQRRPAIRANNVDIRVAVVDQHARHVEVAPLGG